MIWLEAEELVKVNLANNPSTYNNMFEQGWRLPTFFELNEAVRTGEVVLQNGATYATSDTVIEDNEIYYVCLVIREKIPRKLLVGIINVYVYAKLCIDKIPKKIEAHPDNSKKVMVHSELNIKNLKCCGNCMYYSLSGYCCNPMRPKKFYKTFAKSVCTDWEFDARNYLCYSESGESRINLHNQYMDEKVDKLTQHEMDFFIYLKNKKERMEDLF